MKNTGMHNNFDLVELKRYFLYNFTCWWCNQSHADCFHHAVGRGNGDSKCESSVLNAIPLNNFQCHLPVHGKLRKDENVKILLQKNMRYLLKQGFEFKEKDKEFVGKYYKYYE